MERDELIQQNIHSHGRIKVVRLLTCSEFSVEHVDGFAAVIADPRAATEGPIQSVALVDDPHQGLATDFRILKSFVLFEGPDHQQQDVEAIPPSQRALEHA
jgi:hypothetical protein